MKLWTVARNDVLGLQAQPVDPMVARGLLLIWTGSDAFETDTVEADQYLVAQRDLLRHLLCGCNGNNLSTAPRLLCKRIGEIGPTFLSRDSNRPEHDPSCPFFRENWINPDRPRLAPAERTAREYELADLFLGIGGQAAVRNPSPRLPPRRSDTQEDGSSRPPSMATALDLILELSDLNQAHVPYPTDPADVRIFPEQMVSASLNRVIQPGSQSTRLGEICLVQPPSLATAIADLYASARQAWRGPRSPVGYLIFVCDDLIHHLNRSVAHYRTGGGILEVTLDFRIPCARQNVSGPFLVICKVGMPANASSPVILEAASQAVAARSDWWAVDSIWERESYRNLRHVLKAAAEEGLVVEAWRPLRWLTGRSGGLFLPDYWLRCQSSWGCWHNLFVEVEGTRDAAGREMKERTIERAKSRGGVWREDRRDGRRERADRVQRATILEWARRMGEAAPQANSDPD